MTPENKKLSQVILNKEEISIIATLLLGDGCLHNKGLLTINHSSKQYDFLNWKSSFLNKVNSVNTNVKQYKTKCSLQLQRKILKNLHTTFYPANRKNLKILLESIIEPKLALISG